MNRMGSCINERRAGVSIGRGDGGEGGKGNKRGPMPVHAERSQRRGLPSLKRLFSLKRVVEGRVASNVPTISE